MKLYSTVRGQGQAEQIIEKSRFIAYVSPVETKEASSGGLFTITDTAYTDVVRVTLCLAPEKKDEVISAVTNLSGGKAALKNQCVEFVKK